MKHKDTICEVKYTYTLTYISKTMANVALNIYGLYLQNASASDGVGLPNVVTLRGPALCQRSLRTKQRTTSRVMFDQSTS